MSFIPQLVSDYLGQNNTLRLISSEWNESINNRDQDIITSLMGKYPYAKGQTDAFEMAIHADDMPMVRLILQEYKHLYPIVYDWEWLFTLTKSIDMGRLILKHTNTGIISMNYIRKMQDRYLPTGWRPSSINEVFMYDEINHLKELVPNMDRNSINTLLWHYTGESSNLSKEMSIYLYEQGFNVGSSIKGAIEDDVHAEVYPWHVATYDAYRIYQQMKYMRRITWYRYLDRASGRVLEELLQDEDIVYSYLDYGHSPSREVTERIASIYSSDTDIMYKVLVQALIYDWISLLDRYMSMKYIYWISNREDVDLLSNAKMIQMGKYSDIIFEIMNK